MPTFSNIEVTATVDIDFEVFCSCGAHMCGETDTRNSRNRNAPQAIVNPCQRCIDAATDPLREQIEELKAELLELQNTLPGPSEC
jgi:hypothetical protein